MTFTMPTDGQLLLTQFIWGKMKEVPATQEGVERLKQMNIPFPEELSAWMMCDWLYDPAWTYRQIPVMHRKSLMSL